MFERPLHAILVTLRQASQRHNSLFLDYNDPLFCSEGRLS